MAQQVYNVGEEPVPGSGYRLVEFIGRGGFGEVWKATGPGGIEVALKIIRLGGIEGRKEFRALQLCKRIRHPNVVPILAFWLKGADGSVLDDSLIDQQEELRATAAAASPLQETMVVPPGAAAPKASELVIVMGLGDRSLTDRLRQCQGEGLDGIPTEELLGYIEDAAEAIDYLSNPDRDSGPLRASIQHCDIKPQNILIVGGATQVCDFGLARDMASDKTTTAAASLAYAAPEYLEKGHPSPTTDQYSLAVTYYELKTGTLPYDSETHVAVVQAKLQGGLDFSHVPPPEQDVLRRATAQDPDERFPSAVAMVKALRQAASGESTALYTPEAAPPARSSLPMVKALVFLPLLVAAAVGGWLVWRAIGPHGGVTIEQAEAAESAAQSPADFAKAADMYTAVIDSEPSTEVSLRAYLGRGRCREKRQEYRDAIADYEKAAKIDETSAEAYLGRARCLKEMGRVELAIAALDDLLKRDPKNREALALRAEWRAEPTVSIDQAEAAESAAQSPADFAKAADMYTAVIDTEPRRDVMLRAYLGRGRSREKAGEYAVAVASFAAAAELDESNAEARLGQARCQVAMGRPDLAEAPLDKVIQRDETNGDAFILRAQCHLDQKDWDGAIADFESARKIDDDRYGRHPEFAQAYVMRGLDKLGEDRDAADGHDLPTYDAIINDFEEAVSLDPDNSLGFVKPEPFANAYVGRARQHLIEGEYPEAVDDCDRAQQCNADDARIYSRRGSAYFRQGDTKEQTDQFTEKAIEEFTKAIDLDRQQTEDDIIDLVNRGRAHSRLEQYDDAIADFTAAIQQDKKQEQASPYYYRGRCRFEKNDFQGALDDYSKALEIAKQYPDTDFEPSDAYLDRALSYRALADAAEGAEKQQDFERAIGDLSETLKLGSNSPAELHAARAEWYRQINHPEAAAFDEQIIGFYQRLNTAPNDKETLRQLADLLATCPVEQIRNGKLAVELATKAAAGEEAEKPEYLATLAAAQAESGDPEKAVPVAEKALAAAGDANIKQQIEAQLAQYRQGKPWHRPQ